MALNQNVSPVEQFILETEREGETEALLPSQERQPQEAETLRAAEKSSTLLLLRVVASEAKQKVGGVSSSSSPLLIEIAKVDLGVVDVD